MSSINLAAPRTLADALPGGLVRNLVLIASGASFVGVSAQVAIPLPFTPIPLSLQTFAVLLSVSVLGSHRGLAAMGLYAAAGLMGVPWFTGIQSGFSFASFGYVIGFVLAALVVGPLAERGFDRHVGKAVGLMVVGNLAIYAVGVPWLLVFAHLSLAQAITVGVLPFLPGDALKVGAAAGLLPATWKLIGSER